MPFRHNPELKSQDMATWTALRLIRFFRTMPWRKIEFEIEEIMCALNLVNNEEEYALHLYTKKKSDNHYYTVWQIPRGMCFKQYQDKRQIFSDNLKGQCLIYPHDGNLVIEVYKGFIPSSVEYRFNYNDYPNLILPIPVGYTAKGLKVWDLIDLPHLKINGTTKTGKSVCLFNILDAIAQNNTYPVKLFVIDFARTDFNYTSSNSIFGYNINHAISITDYLNQEMEKRLNQLAAFQVEKIQTLHQENPEMIQKFPYIVLAFDEFASVAPDFAKNKEDKKAREYIHANIADLSQKARKCGIHIIISCQKPTVDIIPNSIKGQFDGTICLKTANETISQVAIDTGEAAQLPNIKGRALARLGNELEEVQIMRLSFKEAKELFKNYPNRSDENYVKQQAKRLRA